VAHKENVFSLSGDFAPLSELLTEKKFLWKGYDLKEFWRGVRIRDPLAKWDHMLAAYVLKSQPVESFRAIYSEYVGEKLPELPSLGQWHRAHLQLEDVLSRRLAEQNGKRVYEDIEVPLLPVLYGMEEKGVRLDIELLKNESGQLRDEIQKIEATIHKEVGEVFNIGSPKQLGHILFDKLKIPSGKKTKTGYSTDSGVLEKLRDDFPITGQILEYRELMKLKSTYVDALPLLIRPETGRLHTTFNQAVTSTGRLSSTNPNLQNIPIRTPRGSAIRAAFIADEGHCLVSADYSQIELRILAHITGDPNLKRAFADNLDVHTATAAEVFGVKLENVTPELRRTAKAVNFGIAYGMSAFGLAERLDLPRKEAADIIQRYFTRFRNVQDYMTSVVEEGRKKGYVETLIGRRRYVPELFSRNSQEQKFGERAAINAPIQGSASDIVKKAMIDIARAPTTAELLLQVHDELVFEDKDGRAKANSREIQKTMENVVKLDVPLVVQVYTGPNWEEAHS
jgi:DNA polymerase-1